VKMPSGRMAPPEVNSNSDSKEIYKKFSFNDLTIFIADNFLKGKNSIFSIPYFKKFTVKLKGDAIFIV